MHRGTKGYAVEIGNTKYGPWTKVAEGEFSKPVHNVREDMTSLPLSEPQAAQFVSFRCTSWWNTGCLLGYIGAITSDIELQGGKSGVSA